MMMMDLTLVIAAYLILVRDIIKSVPWLNNAHDDPNVTLAVLALGCSFPISLNRTMPHAITPLSVVMIILLGFAFLTFRSCYNFYKFKRYYTWNADLSLWAVSSGAGRRQASLPP